MLLGEVPGDEEDKQGHPFVGPAGRLLDDAIGRGRPRARRRLRHQRGEAFPLGAARQAPAAQEAIRAADRSLQAVAARGDSGRSNPKGSFASARPPHKRCSAAIFASPSSAASSSRANDAAWLMATYHPSAVLRRRTRRTATRMRAEFIDDLHHAAERLTSVTAAR